MCKNGGGIDSRRRQNLEGGILNINELRERLKKMLAEKAVQKSNMPIFKTSAGKLSTIYFNCKLVTLNSDGMFVVGGIIFDLLKHQKIDAIGGLTLGADPISNAVALTYKFNGKSLRAFSVRKHPKDHGTQQWIEGEVYPCDNTVIVEDALTTGRSALMAIEKAQEAGMKILKVIVLIDRQEGGREKIESLGLEVISIFKKEEFL